MPRRTPARSRKHGHERWDRRAAVGAIGRPDRSRGGRVLLLAACLGMSGTCSPLCQAQPVDEGRATAGPEAAAFYARKVRPILEARCYRCHGGTKVRGGLRINSRSDLLEGGDSGPAVSLEEPAESLLLGAVNYQDFEMPPDGRLSDAEIEVLTQWVSAGVPWSSETPRAPDGGRTMTARGDEPPESFWSFQPVVRPRPPGVANSGWAATPVDRFVLGKLEAHGMAPSGPAAKSDLLRRAYYNLIGLPPSPEAVATFVEDDTPDALARVIDRLLASPRYGERWARHWLDLVRYAESNGYERDGAKPFVWRYRDYVIRALNSDKPYDQFLVEQLAGDELERPSPETMIATGYYRLGLWQDEPVDPEQELYEDLDDIVTTTAQAFLGLTLNCARCHDHKLDPIPQRDYYRFLAFFHGINRYGVRSPESVARFSLRSVGTREERREQKERVDAYKRELADVTRRLEEIETMVYEDLPPNEQEDFVHEQHKIRLVKSRVPRVLRPEQLEQYIALRAHHTRLQRAKPAALRQALCITEMGPRARDTYVLARGNAHARGEPVQPGFPEVLSPPAPGISPPSQDGATSGRRLALARWIAGPQNPLTARVMANRIWQHHFGRGIVRSYNNFGLAGDAPSHRHLLDWLASELVRNDWKLKPLHRTLMLSSVYQMASTAREEPLARDPRNDLFWRYDMRRLGAEEIRDSILAVSGELNFRMFGPSIYPEIAPEVLAGQSQPGAGWGTSSPAERARRSIYIHTKRSLPVPLLAAFDAADPDATCPVRFATTQPAQSLAMINGPFLHRRAAALARSLHEDAGTATMSQVRTVLRRVLQRGPSSGEVDRGLRMIERLTERHGLDRAEAVQHFCLMAFNLNEFVYLD